jgi:hypothetical protein
VLTGVSQRQTAADATKKFFTEHTFERLNLRADRGLGDVEFDCGFGEAAFLGHRPKVTQVVVIQEFHDSETSFA